LQHLGFVFWKSFWFVSGHDFSRADPANKNQGFSPCKANPQGLKPKFVAYHCGTAEAVP
jgi:hypothetical protein